MLRGGISGARWIEAENYHLTLRFIGDIDDSTARDIHATLEKIGGWIGPRRRFFTLRRARQTNRGKNKWGLLFASLTPRAKAGSLRRARKY
jgi:2'-5' RNA ligase